MAELTLSKKIQQAVRKSIYLEEAAQRFMDILGILHICPKVVYTFGDFV